MTPKQVYRCMNSLDKFEFGGVIPSSALKLLLKIPKSDNLNIYYILMLRCEINHDVRTNHYIVLIKCSLCFRLFDPLGFNIMYSDTNVRSFMSKTTCYVTFMNCQPIYSRQCSLYCIFFIYLHRKGFETDECLILLKSIRVPKNIHLASGLRTFTCFLSSLKSLLVTSNRLK
jgi:hypothetical protein